MAGEDEDLRGARGLVEEAAGGGYAVIVSVDEVVVEDKDLTGGSVCEQFGETQAREKRQLFSGAEGDSSRAIFDTVEVEREPSLSVGSKATSE
ncbi:MAG: hypothetical protein ACYCW6_29010 [Candidatus Xenobia bacterium]